MNCISFSSAPVKATVCPSLVVDHTAMYFTPDEFYKISLSKYKAPAEAVWGMMQVKQCTDEISIVDRFRIANALVTLSSLCIETSTQVNSQEGGQGAAPWGHRL